MCFIIYYEHIVYCATSVCCINKCMYSVVRLLSNFILKGLKSKKSGHHVSQGQEGKETKEKQPEGLEEKPGA